MHFFRNLIASTLLVVAATTSHAQIYFQDNSTYTFNGNDNPVNSPVGGYAFGGPPVFFWAFSNPASANTPLTLRLTLSGMPANSSTNGVYLYLWDNISSQAVNGFLDSNNPIYNFRNGTYTLSVTPNAITEAALFGANSWGPELSVTISDVCIFGPGGCSNGPSSADTVAALQLLAASLKTPFVLSKATSVNSLSYDCDRFDAKNLCFTAIGRRLSGNGTDFSESAAALMLVHKLSPHWRIGGLVDQGSSSSTAALRVASDMPLVGINAIWNARPDGEGLEVRSGVAFRQQSLDITRSVVGTSEAGAGSTQMSSTLASVTGLFNHRLSETWTVAPYASLRYYRGQLNGYTEATSGSVTTPLTYAGLAEHTITASLGLRTTGRFGKTIGMASIGVNRDLTSQLDPLSATGVSGMTPVALDGYERHVTRAEASLGLSRDLGERQNVGLTALYRQEAFRNTATTAVFVQYRVGF